MCKVYFHITKCCERSVIAIDLLQVERVTECFKHCASAVSQYVVWPLICFSLSLESQVCKRPVYFSGQRWTTRIDRTVMKAQENLNDSKSIQNSNVAFVVKQQHVQSLPVYQTKLLNHQQVYPKQQPIFRCRHHDYQQNSYIMMSSYSAWPSELQGQDCCAGGSWISLASNQPVQSINSTT